MPTLLGYSLLSCFRHCYSKPTRPFFTYLTYSNVHTPAPAPAPNLDQSSIINYLTESLGFAQPRARSISNRFSSTKTTEKPHPWSVVRFLKNLGFSDLDIRSSINVSPQILFSNIDNTLKPKIQFFQELGLTGSDLVEFISKNPSFLTHIFDERLMPCIDVIKRVLTYDPNNEYLIHTLKRSNWVDLKNPELRVSANISYLESCGIVGSQLIMIMTKQPRLLIMRNCDLRDLVSRVIDMGFSIGTRMLVHALFTVSCMSSKTLARKFEVFQSFGFSKFECMEMFRKAPALFRASEGKLKLGIKFFTETVKFDKAVLIRRPQCLMHSMEDRVIPRYRVLQIMKSKRLLKKEPKFLNVLGLPEEEFLDKFISRFSDNAEELLLAYKCGDLDFSEE